MMNKEGIPNDALTLFEHVEILHQWVGNLNLAIEW
jgi:hypothetical protein